MNARLSSLTVALLGFVALSPVQAQLLPNQNITHLVMPMDIVNGFAPPNGGPSRVRVPAHEYVTMSATTVPFNQTTVFQWTKNGQPIPGATTSFLVLPDTSPSDGGTYDLAALPFPNLSYGIRLDVVPEGNLANVSSRVDLVGTTPQVVGFIVTGTKPKTLLYRAVGSTLKTFGVKNTAVHPVVKCFDGAGHEIGFVHIPEAPQGNELFQRVGAFPVSADELPKLSYDSGPFKPGSYTLHVSDDAGVGGTALVEVYEVP